MVEIHLFGKLRGYARDTESAGEPTVKMVPKADETVNSILTRAGIPVEEIHNIFLNHKLLAARSGMALWLGHQQVRDDPFNWDLDVPVKPGDRLGLFGRDMALLVV